MNAALRDIDAIVEYARSLPDADADRIALLGVSRGGFLSVAYAAEGRHRAQVRAVVNLVGGWVAQAEDRCPADFNLARFARYGAETRTPMLWLYGADDKFYGDAAVESYFATFRAKGGNGRFRLVTGIPRNGHWLPEHKQKWLPDVDAFLGDLRIISGTKGNP